MSVPLTKKERHVCQNPQQMGKWEKQNYHMIAPPPKSIFVQHKSMSFLRLFSATKKNATYYNSASKNKVQRVFSKGTASWVYVYPTKHDNCLPDAGQKPTLSRKNRNNTLTTPKKWQFVLPSERSMVPTDVHSLPPRNPISAQDSRLLSGMEFFGNTATIE